MPPPGDGTYGPCFLPARRSAIIGSLLVGLHGSHPVVRACNEPHFVGPRWHACRTEHVFPSRPECDTSRRACWGGVVRGSTRWTTARGGARARHLSGGDRQGLRAVGREREMGKRPAGRLLTSRSRRTRRRPRPDCRSEGRVRPEYRRVRPRTFLQNGHGRELRGTLGRARRVR
jgi:hypothetical protein